MAEYYKRNKIVIQGNTFQFTFDFSSFFRQFAIYCYRAKLVDFDEERSCFFIRNN